MTQPVERHPFEPFLPKGCRLLMLGSFPPAEKRWAMRFYYPNYINDMWRIFGIVFFNNKQYFVDEPHKTFKLELLIPFLEEKGVGLFDTATAVRRTTGTAADKDLEVVEPTDLSALLRKIPDCKAIVTTGEKATDVLRAWFGIAQTPAVGAYVDFTFEGRALRLYRMPSSSRAYPMKLENKAAIYKPMLTTLLSNKEEGKSKPRHTNLSTSTRKNE